MGKGFGSCKPKTNDNNSLKLEEVIDMYKFADHPDVWTAIRFLDKSILACKRHWIKIVTGSDKKEVTIPRYCISFNTETEETMEDVECPYDSLSSNNKDASVRDELFYLVNGIVRDLQDDEPARKQPMAKKEKSTGFKDIKSKAWSPVKVIRLTPGLVSRMQDLSETNKVKNRRTGKIRTYDVSDNKFGCDINIKYRPKKAGSEKYVIDKVEGRTPLTEEELEYLTWDLSPTLLDLTGRLPYEKAIEDFKRLNLVDAEVIDEEEDDGDDEDYDLGRSRRKSKKKTSRSRREEVFEDEDDDEPVRKRRTSSSTSKRSRPSSKSSKSESSKRRRPSSKSSKSESSRPSSTSKRSRPASKSSESRTSKRSRPATKRRPQDDEWDD